MLRYTHLNDCIYLCFAVSYKNIIQHIFTFVNSKLKIFLNFFLIFFRLLFSHIIIMKNFSVALRDISLLCSRVACLGIFHTMSLQEYTYNAFSLSYPHDYTHTYIGICLVPVLHLHLDGKCLAPLPELRPGKVQFGA